MPAHPRNGPKVNGDDWIGHPGANPSKGKRMVDEPRDPKGRQDGLFTVLKTEPTHPGRVEEDAWIGNRLLNPGHCGRAKALGPEELRGR